MIYIQAQGDSEYDYRFCARISKWELHLILKCGREEKHIVFPHYHACLLHNSGRCFFFFLINPNSLFSGCVE